MTTENNINTAKVTADTDRIARLKEQYLSTLQEIGTGTLRNLPG
jgi:hypothetical protein